MSCGEIDKLELGGTSVDVRNGGLIRLVSCGVDDSIGEDNNGIWLDLAGKWLGVTGVEREEGLSSGTLMVYLDAAIWMLEKGGEDGAGRALID